MGTKPMPQKIDRSKLDKVKRKGTNPLWWMIFGNYADERFRKNKIAWIAPLMIAGGLAFLFLAPNCMQ